MGVTVAVTRVAADTGGGTQNITTSDLGGLTPKAVLLIASSATADDTAAADAIVSLGFTDGTGEFNTYQYSEDNVSTSNAVQTIATTHVLRVELPGGVDAQAGFNAWITNGVTLTWDVTPGAAYLVTAIFFAGTDLSVDVGSVSLSNTLNDTQDVTAPGFEPDVVITVTDDTINTGFVHNDRAAGITQRALFSVSRTGRSTTEIYGRLYESYGGLAREGAWASDAACWIEFSTFDSSGFSVTQRNAASNEVMGYLALRFGTSPVVSSKVYTFTTPTSTGSSTDTGAGFEPQAVLYFGSQLTGTAYTSTNDAGSVGLAAITANAQYMQSWSDEDNQSTTDAQSLTDDTAVNLPTAAGAASLEAAFTTFTSSGVTLNWSAVEGTARKFIALAIGSGVAAAGNVNLLVGKLGEPFKGKL